MKTPAATKTRVVIAARKAIRETLRDAVSRAGMHLAGDCISTSQLVATVAREHPDLCLLDRELCGGGGLIAIAAIAAAPPRPPIVLVVGGRGTPAEVRAARLAGAAASVRADIDAASLAAAAIELVHKEMP